MTELVGRRVLVVGINYAPEHTGIAPHTTQACEYLESLGAEVLVLAGVPHYPHWSTPTEYRRRLRVDEVRRQVPVRRLRHYEPSRQTALTRGAYELTFGLHVLVQRLPWRPDVVVLAVVPSLFGATAASVIARRTGARLVVWVQDLMGPAAAQSGIPGGSRVAGVTTWLEHTLMRRADSVLVLSEGFRRYVESVGVLPSRVEVVRNWSHVVAPTADRAAVRARLGWPVDTVVALHTGNMGLKQGLENVVEAARLALELAPRVRFVLMGDGSQRAELEQLGAEVSTLEFLASASSEAYPETLAAADLLLLSERASAVDMSLPSKLTSYFRAGGPVLAAVPPDGGTAREVHASGAGLVVAPEDPGALLDGVLKLANSTRLPMRADAARAHVEKHLGPLAGLAKLAHTVSGNA